MEVTDRMRPLTLYGHFSAEDRLTSDESIWGNFTLNPSHTTVSGSMIHVRTVAGHKFVAMPDDMTNDGQYEYSNLKAYERWRSNQP
jgi:hypothetical protein